VLLVAVGCGPGQGAVGQSMTRADLAVMVLPRDELGPLARGLVVDDDSGPSGNRAAASESINPRDRARSLRRAGRLDGYELTYSDSTSTALGAGEGVTSVSTSVELFRDEKAVAAFLDQETDVCKRFRATDVEDVKLVDCDTVEVGDVGDGAAGLLLAARFSDIRTFGTIVSFRRGRIHGTANVWRADRDDVLAETRRIARLLDDRIQRVLAGTIDAEPVPVPKQQAAPAADPALLTLRLGDLPRGTSVAGQGYKQHGDVPSYFREFDLGQARLSGSKVLYLRGMAQVLANKSSALYFHRFSRTPKGSRTLAGEFLQRVLNVDPEGAEIRLLPQSRTDTAAFRVSFDAPKGRFVTVFVIVRAGRSIGSITAVGRRAELDPADILSLARNVRARLRS
jgi:hypothetical protein